MSVDARTVRGVIAGAGLLVGIMLALAGVAIMMGMIERDPGGRLDLTRWIVLELVGGAIASVFAGALSRRMAGSRRGPLTLAACAFTVGLLEATEILRVTAAGRAVAPTWLVLLAPVVTAAGVLLGGLVRGPWHPHLPGATRLRLLSSSLPWVLPVLVLIAAATLSTVALPQVKAGTPSFVLAAALTLDLTIVVPGLAFALLVLARRAPWLIIIPTVVVGYALAAATIPTEHQAALGWIRFLVVPAELAVLTYLVVLARRVFAGASGHDGDFASRFRVAARRVLASRIPADILTTEISILHYAFRWRKPAPAGAGTFTMHRKAGFLVITIGLLLVLLVETLPVHLFVRQWSNWAAWTLTGLSLYACLWLVGDYRALVARPIRMTGTHLVMRVGVRWEAEIPLWRIAGAEPLAWNHEQPPRDTLVAGMEGLVNLRVRFADPVEVIGMYGIRRSATEVWLTVDEPERLSAALRAAAGGTRTAGDGTS